mgnify:CR=1 FL=1
MGYEEQHDSSARRYVGVSADRKPRPGQVGTDGATVDEAHYPDGSVLTEVDTGLQYVWHDQRWKLIRHPLSGLVQQILAEQRKQTQLLQELVKQKGT